MKLKVKTKDIDKPYQKKFIPPKALDKNKLEEILDDCIPDFDDNKPKSGTCYIVEFYFIQKDGLIKKLVKIGITERDIATRCSEVAVSYFMRYRIAPGFYAKRFRVSENYRDIEKKLHQRFKNRQYKFPKKFQGYTEFFDVSLESVVIAYDHLIKSDKTS